MLRIPNKLISPYLRILNIHKELNNREKVVGMIIQAGHSRVAKKRNVNNKILSKSLSRNKKKIGIKLFKIKSNFQNNTQKNQQMKG